MSLLSNAKWNSFSQLFKFFVQLINLVYLAKIISPDEYGILAMATVVVNLGMLLRDLGTSSAIIQKKVLTEKLIDTVFWLNIAVGFLLCFILSASSPLIANIYSQPKVLPVLLLLSLIFPLSSSSAVHLALMERESKFKKISFIEITSSFVSVFLAIVLANLGYGVYSLVFQSILMNLMSTLLFWNFSNWRPSFKLFIDKEQFKSILMFSSNISLFNIINYFSRNADNFIIGKFMSPFILGSYNLAYRIMLFPLQSLTFVASRSLYPILSHHQEDIDKIREIYLNCTFIILFITAPIMSGLAFFSHPFIISVFGEQWYLTSDILKWLAPTAILQSVLSTTGSVFMARDRTDILLKLGLLGAVLQVGSFLIGIKFSILTFSKLYFIANIINFIPAMAVLFFILEGSFFHFMRFISPIIISSCTMVIYLYSTSRMLNINVNILNIYDVFIFSASAAIIYLFSLFILSRLFRSRVMDFIKQYFNFN